jgi:predicted metal-binding protein
LADGASIPVVQLLVCTTCRLPDADPAAARPGSDLAGLLAGHAPDGVRVVPVECLSNCSRGCTVALRAPRRWTYVYGNLDPAQHLAAIVEGAAKYRDAADGLVPWRERPEHFRKNCIARIPPLEDPHG